MEGEEQVMAGLVDKLCDHLSQERIKTLIDNGFDQWDTFTYMTGDELVELGFTSEECIIVAVAANANAKEFGYPVIFDELNFQTLIEKAKNYQQALERRLLTQKPQIIKEQVPQGPRKQITEALLLKRANVKVRQGEKIQLGKLTLMNLEQKEITVITELDKLPLLQHLYLNRNLISKIEGLETLKYMKILKLGSNRISKINGLENLPLLQRLELQDNFITRLENLYHHKQLVYLNLSSQRSTAQFTFEERTCQELAYCLEKMQCNSNRVEDITYLKHLQVLNELRLRDNAIQEIEALSEPLGSITKLTILDLRGCPITTLPKYRDYAVILSKSLEELDNKKILPVERQYLVKLYSLKHAKQQRQEGPSEPQKQRELGLQGVKMEEGHGQYNSTADLRGNAPYTNTKVTRK